MSARAAAAPPLRGPRQQPASAGAAPRARGAGRTSAAAPYVSHGPLLSGAGQPAALQDVVLCNGTAVQLPARRSSGHGGASGRRRPPSARERRPVPPVPPSPPQQQEQQQREQQQHRNEQYEQQHEQQQHEQQQAPARVRRRWCAMRNWQWLASQLACGSSTRSESGSLAATVDALTQLAQPGVAPSPHDQQQADAYRAFLCQLLLSAAQQLRAAGAAVAPQDVTDLLWGLAKLGLAPRWPDEQQQQAQQQEPAHGRASAGGPAATALATRAADAAAAAADCLAAHLQQQERPGHGSGAAAGAGYSPRQLALCGWALARLRHPAGPAQRAALWSPYLAAVRRALPACGAQDLSNVAWALARLPLDPGPGWLAEFRGAARRALAGGGGAGGQAAGVILLSLAQLGAAPPAEWVDGVLSELQQQPRGAWAGGAGAPPPALQALNGRALASVLGALAKWGHAPRAAWLANAADAVAARLPQCNGQDVVQLAWALATLAGASAGGGSGSLRGDEQEPGLARLQRQLQHPGGVDDGISSDGSGGGGGGASLAVLGAGLPQQLAHRLAETARGTAPCQVALGMWAVAKLHQLSQPGAQRGWVVAQSGHLPEAASARVHWQPCVGALLHCTAVLQEQHAAGLAGLDCKHLSLLAWALAAAGGGGGGSGTARPQQRPPQPQRVLRAAGPQPVGRQAPGQQQARQGGRSSSSSSSGGGGSSSSSSSRGTTGFSVPGQLVQQLLAASRRGLRTAQPRSAALLLCAAVRLGAAPSWQWLLEFYEATQPHLGSCSAQDLGMAASALSELGMRPLARWQVGFLRASTALADGGLAAGSLAAIVTAAAAPAWGLAAAVGGASDGAPYELLAVVPAWAAAMQRQVARRLPELTLSQATSLLRAAAQLGWHSDARDAGGVVPGLLAAALERSRAGTQQLASGGDPVALLQQQLRLASAALRLPAGEVASGWWAELAGQLAASAQALPHPAAAASHAQVLAGLRTLARAARQQHQLGNEPAAQRVGACLEALVAVAAAATPALPLEHSLALVAAAHASLRVAGAPPAAAEQLGAAACAALAAQLPRLGLRDLAALLAQASRLGLLARPAAAAAAEEAPEQPHGERPPCAAKAAVLALQQQLGALQQQGVLEALESGAQQPHAPARPGAAAAAPASAAAAAAAGHVATVLAALAGSGYRPPAETLRQALQLVGAALPLLGAGHLAAVAHAAAGLRVGALAPRGFRPALWRALAAALRPTRPQRQLQAGGDRRGGGAAAAAAKRRHQAPRRGDGGAHAARVLLVARALHALAEGSGDGAFGGRALGAPPPRRLAERALWAAGSVWQQLGRDGGPGRARGAQQQAELVRLLAPAAALLSSAGMARLHLRLGRRLRQLPAGPDRAAAFAAWRELVAAWRAGRERRGALAAAARLARGGARLRGAGAALAAAAQQGLGAVPPAAGVASEELALL
ncbi:hypothetical protein HT031_006077 [Scenedesmus sp. PABB004]|nr:hypothetical protein HT031_006077 [Scenedesmus sp. PABB004]